jgi:large subunit ribosomal protein L15
MKLNILVNNPGSKKTGKRLGRGIGSGKGKTCGRGVKGQKARSGVAIKGFEGGQMPLIKRLPKRGFNCPSTKKYQLVKIEQIEHLILTKRIDVTKVINREALLKAGVIKVKSLPVKLLAVGDKISKKVSIQLDAYSKTAKEIIEKAGGQIL